MATKRLDDVTGARWTFEVKERLAIVLELYLRVDKQTLLDVI